MLTNLITFISKTLLFSHEQRPTVSSILEAETLNGSWTETEVLGWHWHW